MTNSSGDSKYLTKVVFFKGEKLTLFSMDGLIWSSRKNELSTIMQRQETQRLELMGKELEGEGGFAASPKLANDEDEADTDVAADPIASKEASDEDEAGVFRFETDEEDDEVEQKVVRTPVAASTAPKNQKQKLSIAKPSLAAKPEKGSKSVPTAAKVAPKKIEKQQKKSVKPAAKRLSPKKKPAPVAKRRKAA